MITAAISAAVVAILALFGIHLSGGQIAGVVVAAKILVVGTGALIALRISRKRRAAAAAAAAVPPPDTTSATGSG